VGYKLLTCGHSDPGGTKVQSVPIKGLFSKKFPAHQTYRPCSSPWPISHRGYKWPSVYVTWLNVYYSNFDPEDENSTFIRNVKTARYYIARTANSITITLYRVNQNDCRGTIVQRQFRTKFGKQPPSDNSIRRRYAQFQETGCVCIPELKVRIRTAIEAITADMLQTVWNELDYRVDVCRITKDAYTDHL